MNARTKVPAMQDNGKVTAWAAFQNEIKEREQSIVAMLPQHVGKQRFINSAIAAVKQNPDLLTATARSLMTAITKSAQDGLLPDGREGVITVYNEKQRDNTYLKIAQWNPMVYGLRKRARELDNIIINAQVVHENDKFSREEGDDPRIEHQPAPLGQERGKLIGAYAIFRNADGILHREVMEAAQINAVRSQSRAPDGLMWKKFTEEAWRKTVVRRGIKSVPCSDKLEEIVRRDDETFDFQNGPAKPKLEVVTPPAEGERRPLPPLVTANEDAPIEVEGDVVQDEALTQPGTAWDEADWLRNLEGALDGCEDFASVGEKQRDVMMPEKSRASPNGWKKAEKLVSAALDRINTTLAAG